MSNLPALTQAQREQFFSDMLPYAQEASKKLNIPVSVILGQWADESYYGHSRLAENDLNYGGIKHVAASIGIGQDGDFEKYVSKEQFVQDYERILDLSYYNGVRDAGTVADTVKALGQSPYAGSHYGGQGQDVMAVISTNNLTQYDQPNAYSAVNGSPVSTSEMNPTQLHKYAAIGAMFAGLLGLAVAASSGKKS